MIFKVFQSSTLLFSLNFHLHNFAPHCNIALFLFICNLYFFSFPYSAYSYFSKTLCTVQICALYWLEYLPINCCLNFRLIIFIAILGLHVVMVWVQQQHFHIHQQYQQQIISICQQNQKMKVKIYSSIKMFWLFSFSGSKGMFLEYIRIPESKHDSVTQVSTKTHHQDHLLHNLQQHSKFHKHFTNKNCH